GPRGTQVVMMTCGVATRAVQPQAEPMGSENGTDKGEQEQPGSGICPGRSAAQPSDHDAESRKPLQSEPLHQNDSVMFCPQVPKGPGPAHWWVAALYTSGMLALPAAHGQSLLGSVMVACRVVGRATLQQVVVTVQPAAGQGLLIRVYGIFL